MWMNFLEDRTHQTADEDYKLFISSGGDKRFQLSEGYTIGQGDGYKGGFVKDKEY